MRLGWQPASFHSLPRALAMDSLAASITLMPGSRSCCCISAVQHVGHAPGGVLVYFSLASDRVAAPVTPLCYPSHASMLPP